MTTAILLVAALTSQPSAAPAKVEPGSGRTLTFVLDANTRAFSLGVNIANVTDMKTPADCQMALGDPEFFAVLTSTPRRFIVTVVQERLGASTNVTFDCAEGARFTVELRQVPTGEAATLVDFVFSAEDTARVRAAVEVERKRCAQDGEAKTVELREVLGRDARDQFVAGLLRRFITNDDAESARQDFVIVHVTQQLLAGDRAYIVFTVQNRSGKEVVVADASVTLGDSEGSPTPTVLTMPDKRVPASQSRTAVASFDAPDDLSTVALMVREDGPRSIVVDDIDF